MMIATVPNTKNRMTLRRHVGRRRKVLSAKMGVFTFLLLSFPSSPLFTKGTFCLSMVTAFGCIPSYCSYSLQTKTFRTKSIMDNNSNHQMMNQRNDDCYHTTTTTFRRARTSYYTRRTHLFSMHNDYKENNDDDFAKVPIPKPTPTPTPLPTPAALSTIKQTITNNPKQSILFSISMSAAGAILGPFLDTYHSIFGVLQYDHPITAQLWGYGNQNVDIPALVTTWWVPYLFGLAGFIIGWLYIILDSVLTQSQSMRQGGEDVEQAEQAEATTTILSSATTTISPPMGYSPPIICLGISIFTFQYWLSGILSAYNIDRSVIFIIMSIYACIGYVKLDNTKSGFITSLATAIGGPLIEIGLISFLNDSVGGYHYVDSGETGFFPLWIVPVYFLGGPANGNLARGIWDALGNTSTNTNSSGSGSDPSLPKGCKVCNDTRVTPCPNCDGIGYYITYGREVKCNCCKGRGYVICRECFHLYDEDPSDIESIREMMSRLPD